MKPTRGFSVGAMPICLAMLMLFVAGSAGAQKAERMARTNPSGESCFLDESQVAQEIAKEQQIQQANCK